MRNKKMIAVLTLLCFMFTFMPVAALADEATGTNVAYASANMDDRSVIWGEYNGEAITESFKIELYSDETLMATTVLNNVDNILDLGLKAISWHILLQGSVDEYWTTTWVEPHPIKTVEPTHIVTYVNGKSLGESIVSFDGPDNLYPATWKDMPGVMTYESDAEKLHKLLTEASDAGSGDVKIVLTKDYDLAGAAWTPVTVDGYNGAGVVTIEGKGHSITGLSAPLFAGGFAGTSGIVIKDLTIKNSTIVSTNTLGSGAFIETVDSMPKIELTNCHLLNSTLTGSRTGGLIGWTSGYNNENDGPVKTYVTIKDCSVIDCNITGDGTVGGIYGHAGANAWTYSTIENCTVQNCTLISNDDSYRVGVVLGTANVGQVTIENITYSGNTLTQNNNGTIIDRPEGQSDLYGREALGETGKLMINQPAAGHEHNYTTTVVAATCTTDGYTLKFCACGVETKTVTEATGHSYTDETIAPSCTAQGYTTHNCTKCGHSYTDTYTDATGHNWGEDESKSVAATADANGVAIYICDNCKVSKSETIPKTGHTFDGGKTVAPTCTEQGYTEHTCTTCGNNGVIHTYRDNLTDATGHKLTSKETPATCKAKGYTTYTCYECGYTFTDNITAVIAHVWTVTDMTAATGNTAGSKTYTCFGCGAKKTEVIPPTGCSFNAVVTAPTCTEQGYTTFTCTTCTGDDANHSYKGNYVAAAGHTVKSEVTAPTCTAKGYTTHTCQVAGCTYSIKSAVTDMLPHNYVYSSTVAATSDTDGKIIYKCSGCNAEKTEVIPATGTGHNFTSAVTKNAACDTDGVITYTCTNCANHSYTESIPAIGHNWDNGKKTDETCISSGYTTYTCSTCQAKRVTDMTAMTDHNFGDKGNCIVCGVVNAAALPEEALQSESKTLSTIPATLSYSTTDELQAAMEEAVNVGTGSTSTLLDISLAAENTALQANNFPVDGYVFKIKLPEGASKDTNFIVSHMITETYGGSLAGDIETLNSWVEDGYVCFRVYSTSPVMLSYAKAAADTTDPSTPSDPSDSTTPSTPSNNGGGFSGTYNYPVSAPKADNASVSLSDNNASAGEKVTATVKPDNGYGVYEVIVTDEKGNIIPVTMLGNGEYSFVMPAGKVNIETICKPAITLTVGNENANVFGKTVKNDVAPVIRDNRTMLPIRFIAEALNGTVAWNEAAQTVTISKDGVKVQIIIGADYAYINGEKVKLDSKAFIENSRTYLPVRFVSEALGATVNWDAAAQQVVIMK